MRSAVSLSAPDPGGEIGGGLPPDSAGERPTAVLTALGASRETRQIEVRRHELQETGTCALVPAFPKAVLVELSSHCNHDCVFCPVQESSRTGSVEDPSLMERIIREAKELGASEIGFHSGGEPFASKLLEHFIAFSKDLGYAYICVSTNGVLATPKRLQSCFDAGISSIKFSINGGDRETYKQIHGRDDFEKVLRHVEYASLYRAQSHRQDVYLAVSLVETESGMASLQALRRRLEGWVDEIVSVPLTNSSGQMPGIGDFPKEAPCNVPFNRVHVSSEGYLRLCCNDYQNYLAVADLARAPLREAFYSETFKDMRRRHLENDLRGTLCYNCIHNTSEPIKPLVECLSTPAPHAFFRRRDPLGSNRSRSKAGHVQGGLP